MTIKGSNHESVPGKKLFETSSEFYSWYMTWIHTPSSQAGVFQALSELMRIAALSAEGGLYLSSQEEEKSIEALLKLKEQLSDGHIKKENTLDYIKTLMHDIISQNPKAKLVSCATEVEYRFCILSPPSEHSSYLQSYLDKVLKCITPSLLEIQAYAISQIMNKILENPPPETEAGYILEKEITQWMKLS